MPDNETCKIPIANMYQLESGPSRCKLCTFILFSATMAVYKDFFVYESGVYSRSQFSSGITPLGYHSVKIIGWGEETGTPYWVIII